MKDKNPTKQTPSDKRLFAAIDTLRGQVECQGQRLDAVIEKVKDLTQLVQHVDTRLIDVERQEALPQPDPKDYVLTDADWQRVIAERWLCEFGVAGSAMPYRIGELQKLDYMVGWRVYPTYPNQDVGPWYSKHECRLLQRAGVMQPYFGQGMTVAPNTKVLVKLRTGTHTIGKAREVDWTWDARNNAGDIVAFMVLE